MAHHVLRDVNGNMSAPVVNRDGVSYHLWKDGARSTPGANHFLFTNLVQFLNLLKQLWVDEWPFFQ